MVTLWKFACNNTQCYVSSILSHAVHLCQAQLAPSFLLSHADFLELQILPGDGEAHPFLLVLSLDLFLKNLETISPVLPQ